MWPLFLALLPLAGLSTYALFTTAAEFGELLGRINESAHKDTLL